MLQACNLGPVDIGSEVTSHQLHSQSETLGLERRWDQSVSPGTWGWVQHKERLPGPSGPLCSLEGADRLCCPGWGHPGAPGPGILEPGFAVDSLPAGLSPVSLHSQYPGAPRTAQWVGRQAPGPSRLDWVWLDLSDILMAAWQVLPPLCSFPGSSPSH